MKMFPSRGMEEKLFSHRPLAILSRDTRREGNPDDLAQMFEWHTGRLCYSQGYERFARGDLCELVIRRLHEIAFNLTLSTVDESAKLASR